MLHYPFILHKCSSTFPPRACLNLIACTSFFRKAGHTMVLPKAVKTTLRRPKKPLKLVRSMTNDHKDCHTEGGHLFPFNAHHANPTYSSSSLKMLFLPLPDMLAAQPPTCGRATLPSFFTVVTESWGSTIMIPTQEPANHAVTHFILFKLLNFVVRHLGSQPRAASQRVVVEYSCHVTESFCKLLL